MKKIREICYLLFFFLLYRRLRKKQKIHSFFDRSFQTIFLWRKKRFRGFLCVCCLYLLHIFPLLSLDWFDFFWQIWFVTSLQIFSSLSNHPNILFFVLKSKPFFNKKKKKTQIEIFYSFPGKYTVSYSFQKFRGYLLFPNFAFAFY